MISAALLGYGAAGTFVTLARPALLARYERTFVTAAALFGVTAVAGFVLAQRVGFNPLELLWDPRQPLRLLGVYALLLVPFFCAATALCVTFARFADRAAWVYASDLAGAGAGCLAILAALYAVAPVDALRLVGSMGLAAAAFAAHALRLRPRGIAVALLGAAVAMPLLVPADWVRLRPSEFKELDRTLQVKGARVLAERSSPLGVVTVVESAEVPFRHAPGMSLNAPAGPPEQLGVFVDGEGPSALVRYDGRPEPLAYLDYLTSAAPYHLSERPRVLVLGAGAGADVLQAIALGARTVDAVEQDPQIVDLVERRFGDYSGRPYRAPGVRVHIAEARSFVARSRDRYDMVEVALLDAFGASAAGLYALSESYLYTIEALSAYLDRLEPSGLLAITRWVNLPPRDVLKLFATAVAALERRGVTDPGRQLALVRSWSTATLLVKNAPFTADEIAALREFCRLRSFDADWFPGIAPGDANRYNVLDPSEFEEGARALLGPRARDVHRPLQVRARTADRRPPLLLPLLPLADAAGVARAQGPRRAAAPRLGISGADRGAGAGDPRQRGPDPAAVDGRPARRDGARSRRPARASPSISPRSASPSCSSRSRSSRNSSSSSATRSMRSRSSSARSWYSPDSAAAGRAVWRPRTGWRRHPASLAAAAIGALVARLPRGAAAALRVARSRCPTLRASRSRSR